MTTKSKNYSVDITNNKIFFPSIFNSEYDFNINADPKSYLQTALNKTTRTQRTKSLQFYNQLKQIQKNEQIQIKQEQLEIDKTSYEDQYLYKDKQLQQTNKLQIKLTKTNQIKEIRYKELVNCYCQKFTKKKLPFSLKHHKLDLEFL